MAFLRSAPGPECYAVRGAKTALRPFEHADYTPWAMLRGQSRAHLTPFEPQWQADELERASFRRRLRHYAREQKDDLGYAFGIFRLGDDALLGGVSLSNVRRGVTQAAALGYWLGVPYVRQGYMSDAVAAAIAFSFIELKLHRVEAATLPDNAASIRVLERNGFQREGFARSYLKINGTWRDHVLFGLVADDRERSERPLAKAAGGVAALS